MKKFIYIGVLFLGLVLVSCNKEDFTIQDDDARDTPEWVNPGCGEKAVSSQNGDAADATEDEGGITDPNNDPDGRKKKP